MVRGVLGRLDALAKEAVERRQIALTSHARRRPPEQPPHSRGIRLFIALASAATDPSDYFRLPANRVVELGAHVTV